MYSLVFVSNLKWNEREKVKVSQFWCFHYELNVWKTTGTKIKGKDGKSDQMPVKGWSKRENYKGKERKSDQMPVKVDLR